MSWTARLLRFPAVTFVAVALGVLLCLPALRSGFFADDYLQLRILEGRAGDHSPFDLYRFTGRDEAEAGRAFAQGPWPWYGDTALRSRLFRPLASALLVLDHHLFGGDAIGYHAHGIFWYAALIAVVAALYRRTVPEGTAALSLLVFAVDYTHGLPAGWIASRHSLVAGTLATLGLLAHVRARREGLRAGRWIALVAFAVALTAGETALAVLMYVFAHEAMDGAGDRGERARAAAPYAALAALYLGVYKAAGYGVRGQVNYLDPLGDPLRFLAELPGRAAALSGGKILGVPSDLWMFDSRSRAPLIVIGAAAILLFALALRSALRAATEEERRSVRFWLTGAALSLLVVVNGTIGNRLLLAPGLGATVAIAFTLRHAWRVARKRVPAAAPARAAQTAVAAIFGLVHLVASPLFLAGTMESIRVQATNLARMASAPGLVPAPGSHVVVVAGSDPIATLYGGAYRMATAEPRPAGWHVLSNVVCKHRVTRTGPRTVEIALLDGQMMATEFDGLVRPPDRPLVAGAEVPLDCGSVRVLDAPDGKPTRIEVTFDGDIEGDGFSFVVQDEGAFRKMPLPAQGESIVLDMHPAPSPI